MKESRNPIQQGERRRRLVLFATTLNMNIAMIVLTAGIARAEGTVTDCTEANLRAAIGASGGTVTFACDGTIGLSDTVFIGTDTVLDGSGRQVTISGNRTVRAFCVATNVNFTVLNLTIANGQSTNGAGILNDGGSLVLAGTAFLSNSAIVGPLTGTNSAGCGGAIYNRGGSVIASNCVFIGNNAFGSPSDSFAGSGIGGGDGCGGAIYSAGQLNIADSTFDDNVVQGGAGASAGGSSPGVEYAGAGGSANGGAIFMLGTACVSGSTFVRNSAVGGGGGWGENGMYSMIAGFPGGWGGSGGSGNGAALFIGGSVGLVNCTIASNTATGGTGGHGGNGGFGEYGGSGGWGGAGGAGFSGICDSGGLAAITNCTVAFNMSSGGVGGSGGSGGYGPYSSGSWGDDGTDGSAAGGLRTVGGKLLNTLLAANIPANCSGTITDAGHNLSSDASCVLTNVGSLNNTDPKLGPLADNGGPTLTMALLPGSPAIDAGTTTGAPATDQRGVPRPQGAGVDIGAYEYLSSPIFTGATVLNATTRQLQLCGLSPNQTLTLQVSTNLMNWWDVTNFTSGANGAFQCIDPTCTGGPVRFYRLKSGTP